MTGISGDIEKRRRSCSIYLDEPVPAKYFYFILINYESTFIF